MKKKVFTAVIGLLLLLSGMLIVGINEATAEENVEIKGEDGAYFEPEIVTYTKEVELEDEIEIGYSVNNTGDEPGIQDIILSVKVEIRGEQVYNEEIHREELPLAPGQEWNDTQIYDTEDEEDEYGDIPFIEIKADVEILLETDDASDSAETTVTKPGVIPGFTFILLVIGVTFAVIIYHTKKR
ncbi:MAG: hypothetical protein ACOCSJ_02185 [Candidatus Natronoplasma sp.]